MEESCAGCEASEYYAAIARRNHEAFEQKSKSVVITQEEQMLEIIMEIGKSPLRREGCKIMERLMMPTESFVRTLKNSS